MVKVNEIQNTATFAWSHDPIPTLATGTAAGVIDDNFSSSSTLSFYSLYDKTPVLSVDADAKFHDLDWSKSNSLLAGALENGTIQFWNTEKLSSSQTVTAVAKGEKHSGLIKSLQFNPIQHHVLASGGANGEIFIWDTNKLSNLSPFVPGTAMTPMDVVSSISWNNSVSHIFASAGTTGYTSIWDLKSKKEVLHLSYTSNTGSRATLSTVAWHPTQSTKLITASESDGVPVILTWDLRNSNAPESILEGHKKGVLSLDWNHRDPELLLSSGKDNTTILWNPLTSEKLAQYPTTANWAFKTRFAPSTPDIFATASFDKKIIVQTLQDTSPPVSNRINSTSETDFWNKISDTETQQPEYFVKQAPNWYGRKSSVSFGFGGKFVTVAKTGDKSSEIKISKVKIPGSKDNEALKTALETQDFKSIIDSRIKESYSDVNKSDWELLEKLSTIETSKVFENFIGLKIDNEETEETQGAKDEDFFNNLTEQPKFVPSGDFKLPEDSKELTNALLTKDLSKAVDISLKNDNLVEALIIALNGSQELKDKVTNYYFTKNAANNSVSRLLHSVSSNDVSDFVEHGDVSEWKEIGTAINTYAKDTSVYSTLFTKLGDRILAADPAKNRDTAILNYINASSLAKVANIWIQELKSLESKILESEQRSAYDAHFESLTEFVEKFSAYRSTLKLDIKISDSESLLSTILEYSNIISTSGQFELAKKFLDLLPDDVADVKLEKERIAKATGTTQTKNNVGNSRAGAGRYGNLPQVPGVPSSVPGLQSQTRGRAPPSNPFASPVSTPQVPSYVPPQVSTQSYKPPAAASASNPYKPFDSTPSGPTGPIGSSNPPPPPKSKKIETEGWNDLPSTFHKQPRRATPAAPSNVSNPYNLNSSNGSNQAQPPISRNASFATQASLPPPPRSVSRSRNTPSIGDSKATPPPPQPNNRYAPISAPSPQPASAHLNNASSPHIGGSPLQAPPKNPYAPSAQPVTNPYAPPAQFGQPQQSGPHGNNVTAPPQPTNPYAPVQPQHQQPPQIQQQQQQLGGGYAQAQPGFGAPLPVGNSTLSHPTPLTASASLQQQQQQQSQTSAPPTSTIASAPPKSEPVQPKYPTGDRSHIPSDQLNIYEFLNKTLEIVKPDIPEKYERQFVDTEKRLNILFDHLNNQDLLTPSTIELLQKLVEVLGNKDFDGAFNIHLELATNHSEAGGHWLVGIKRLIQFVVAVN